jgi:hypothetical protein
MLDELLRRVSNHTPLEETEAFPRGRGAGAHYPQ